MKKYHDLPLSKLRKGHRYDFVLPEIDNNGIERMKPYKNHRLDQITNTEVIFAEPKDEDSIEWGMPIPLAVAQTMRFNVSSEGDTDKESQSGGKRKYKKTKTRKTKKIRKTRKNKTKNRK